MSQINLNPANASTPTTNPALTGFAPGSNRDYLIFDDAVQKFASWEFACPAFTGNLSLRLTVSTHGADGAVNFDIAAMTGGGVNINTDNYSSVGTGGTTTSDSVESVITIDIGAGYTAGQYTSIRIARQAPGGVVALARVWPSRIVFTPA